MLPPQLADKIRKEHGPGGCWVWTAAKAGGGYGTIRHAQRMQPAHRVVYTLLVGEIPKGRVLDHRCSVRACVNPDHLDPVTQQVNVSRGNGPQAGGLARGTQALAEKYCKNGHLREGDNLYMHKGHKQCRACKRINQRNYMTNKRNNNNVV